MGDLQPSVPTEPVAPPTAPPAAAPEPAVVPPEPARSPQLYLILGALWLVISLTLAANKWIQHRFASPALPPLGFGDWVPTLVASLAVAGALALLTVAAQAFLKYLKPIAAVAAAACLAWLAFKYVGVA